ncbi:MAG TPA: hypothetical protein VF486_16930 [Actinomycetes bacterium]
MSAGGAGRPLPEQPGGWWFWAAAGAGGLVLAYGLVGLLRHAAGTVPAAWARWLLAVLLANDLLLVPAVLLAGRLLGRTAPAWRRPLRAALLASGVVVLVSLPAFLGHGRATQPGNGSVLPNDYAASLATVLALVWAATLLPTAIAAARRARRRTRRQPR